MINLTFKTSTNKFLTRLKQYILKHIQNCEVFILFYGLINPYNFILSIFLPAQKKNSSCANGLDEKMKWLIHWKEEYNESKSFLSFIKRIYRQIIYMRVQMVVVLVKGRRMSQND